MSEELTGNYRFRNSIFRKLILQVECKPCGWDDTPSSLRWWRDALTTDLKGVLGAKDE